MIMIAAYIWKKVGEQGSIEVRGKKLEILGGRVKWKKMQVKIKITFTYKSKHFFVLVYNFKQDKINIELLNTHSIIFKLSNWKVKF